MVISAGLTVDSYVQQILVSLNSVNNKDAWIVESILVLVVMYSVGESRASTNHRSSLCWTRQCGRAGSGAATDRASQQMQNVVDRADTKLLKGASQRGLSGKIRTRDKR